MSRYPIPTPVGSHPQGGATPTASVSAALATCPPTSGFLRQPQVLGLVPISKSTLWRRVQAGTFPMPVKLSERVTVWRSEDVCRWIGEQGGRS